MTKDWPVKWQCLETKARFIHQVMRGETSVRSAEDLESSALTYAEIKAIASGNPAVVDYVVAEVMWYLSDTGGLLQLIRLQRHHITSRHSDCRKSSRPGLSLQAIRRFGGDTVHFASASAFIFRSTSA